MFPLVARRGRCRDRRSAPCLTCGCSRTSPARWHRARQEVLYHRDACPASGGTVSTPATAPSTIHLFQIFSLLCSHTRRCPASGACSPRPRPRPPLQCWQRRRERRLGREGSELSPPLAYRLRIMTFRAGSGTPCVETPIALVNELGGHVLALFRS